MRHIYLDYNVTTPVSPLVQEAIAPFLVEHYGDPSNPHPMGRACAEAIEEARQDVATLLGAAPEEIIFTSGGTEANNLAIKGPMMRSLPSGQGRLAISEVEHPSVRESAAFLERLGFDLDVIPCNSQGQIEPKTVARTIRPETTLVSVQHANAETGVVQGIEEIAEICHDQGALLHVDATQSIGKIPVNVHEMGVDMMSVSGHRLYALKGAGALYVRSGISIDPLLHGDGHESGRRSGMENTPGIVALGCASRLIFRTQEESIQRQEVIRDRLEKRLREAIGEGLVIFCSEVSRLPNTMCVSFPGVSGARLLARTPELCASSFAWEQGEGNVSSAFRAMKVETNLIRGAVRLCVGWYTSEEDVDRAASLLAAAWDGLS